MKSKILNKIVVSICCACLCIFAGVFFAACGNPEPTVQKIEIDESTIPSKYYVGDAFTVEGLKVTAFYSDGSEKEVTDYSYVAQKGSVSVQKEQVFSSVGTYIVTVTYKKKTATYEIVVKLKPEVTMLDVESTDDYDYIKIMATTLTQYIDYENRLSDKDIYTVKEFVDKMGNFNQIGDILNRYYIEVATLANFDLYDEVTSLTFGNTVYGINDEAALLLGSNKAIKDKVWYVEDDTLYVALPVLYTETSLSNQFKINNVVVTHNLTTATKHNLTDFTTDSTNSVVKDLDGTSNVTLLDETSPLSLKLDESGSGIDISESFVYSKIELENGGSNTCTLYAVGFLEYGCGLYTEDTLGLCMKDVKTGTDGVCDDLDGTSWNCSFVVKYWEETTNSYKNNSYSCKFTISTQGD